jgi:cytochrome c553
MHAGFRLDFFQAPVSRFNACPVRNSAWSVWAPFTEEVCMMKKGIWVLLLALPGVPLLAADPATHWAYPTKAERPTFPGDEGEETLRRIPGSSRTYTQGQIEDLANPPDWFPDKHHAPMPSIVQRGKGDVLACAACHLTSGHGHPESSHLSGLTAAYMMRQLADFKSGARKEPLRMGGFARAISDEDARQAVEWFAALKPAPWVKVVETDTVPKTYIGKGRMRFIAPGGETESIGIRVVELPQDPAGATRRDPRSGFMAYVPKGSIARGEALVTTGGAGKTLQCAICHGPDLKGLGDVPRIAGISPLYAARQLLSIQSGVRAGASAALMQQVVAKLSEEDVVSIAAYLATREP